MKFRSFLSPLINRIQWHFGYDIVGCYIGYSSCYIYAAHHKEDLHYPIKELSPKQKSHADQAHDIFHFCARRFHRTRRLLILFCPTYELFLQNRNNLASILETKPSVKCAYTDPSLCMLMGVGMTVEARKQIYILLTNQQVRGFVVFMSAFLYERIYELDGQEPMVVVQNLIDQLTSAAESPLPEPFSTMALSPQEKQQILEGWSAPMKPQSCVIAATPDAVPLAIDRQESTLIYHPYDPAILEHGLKSLVNDAENVPAGLQVLYDLV